VFASNFTIIVQKKKHNLDISKQLRRSVMIELYIYVGAIPVLILIWLILMIKHYPKRKLTKNIKELILQNGLIHFTLWENAEKIQNEGLKPWQEKAMYFLEKDMVWLYMNNENDFQSKCDIVHKKGKRKEYDAVK
jgi:hypothetical protein